MSGGATSFVPINHKTSTWTTLFIEWFYDSKNISKSKGRYMIDNDESSIEEFKCLDPQPSSNFESISIAGRLDGSHTFHGEIASVDIYTSRNKPQNCELPSELRALIIEDQTESN